MEANHKQEAPAMDESLVRMSDFRILLIYENAGCNTYWLNYMNIFDAVKNFWIIPEIFFSVNKKSINWSKHHVCPNPE